MRGRAGCSAYAAIQAAVEFVVKTQIRLDVGEDHLEFGARHNRLVADRIADEVLHARCRAVSHDRVRPKIRSVRQNLAIALHDLFDHVGTADNACAFRNQIVLRHREKIEVRRAAIEFYARLMRILDEVVDAFRRTWLDEEFFGFALFHQAPGGCRTNDFDVISHSCRHRRLEEWRTQLLAVAWVRIRHDDE